MSCKAIDRDFNDVDDNRNMVVSICENRAREICISKSSSNNISMLEIYLVADSHSYVETLDILEEISPNEILLHDGSKNTVLSKKVEALMKNCDTRVLYISRQYFDQDRGADLLRKILVGKSDQDLIAKYTVLAGTYCLLRYLENILGLSFSNNSVRLAFANRNSGRMNIDRRTSVNLELINNTKTGSQRSSLFSTMNYTKTSVGARLLRENILRPIADVPTVTMRQDLVDIFLQNQEKHEDIRVSLGQLPNLDKLLNGLSNVPKQQTLRTARQGIDTIIFIKETIKHLTSIKQSIEDIRANTTFNCALLQTIAEALDGPELNEIQRIIDNIITESTSFSKSSHIMRHQECFAINSGIHGKLDLSRKQYLQTVEDIYSTVDKYSQELQAQIKVNFNASRGYHLLVPTAVSPLPLIFIQPVLNSKHISCTTELIMSLSDRANEAILTALTITQQLIQERLQSVRKNINILFNICDSIALLDMLSSFSELIIQTPNEPFVRPIMTHSSNNDDILVLVGARHPIICDSKLKSNKRDFVANDSLMDALQNFHIITGPNASGKTVFIKQTALLVIMAQIGSFVPARHATVPVRDRLLSRLGTSDDMEHNLSTFLTEMKETAYILNNITPRSLVVIDEMCRSTSNIDGRRYLLILYYQLFEGSDDVGFSLAFAIAEHMAVNTSAFVLFVTHYPQITILEEMYSNCKNFHMKTAMRTQADPKVDLTFLRTLEAGPCDLRCGYGIIMAETCGFSSEIIQEARRLQRIIRDQLPGLLRATLLPVDDMRNNLNQLLQHLLILRNSRLDNNSLKIYIESLRSRIPPGMDRLMMNSLSEAINECSGHSTTAEASHLSGTTAIVTTTTTTTTAAQPPPSDELDRISLKISPTSVTNLKQSIGLESTREEELEAMMEPVERKLDFGLQGTKRHKGEVD